MIRISSEIFIIINGAQWHRTVRTAISSIDATKSINSSSSNRISTTVARCQDVDYFCLVHYVSKVRLFKSAHYTTRHRYIKQFLDYSAVNTLRWGRETSNRANEFVIRLICILDERYAFFLLVLVRHAAREDVFENDGSNNDLSKIIDTNRRGFFSCFYVNITSMQTKKFPLEWWILNWIIDFYEIPIATAWRWMLCNTHIHKICKIFNISAESFVTVIIFTQWNSNSDRQQCWN